MSRFDFVFGFFCLFVFFHAGLPLLKFIFTIRMRRKLREKSSGEV